MNIKIIKILPLFVFFCTSTSAFYLRGLDASARRLQQFIRNDDLFIHSLSDDAKKLQEDLNNGADINYQRKGDNELKTPLSNAIMASNIEGVKFLIFNGADINIVCKETALGIGDALELAKTCLAIKKSQGFDKHPKLVKSFKVDKAIEIIDLLEKHKSRMEKIKGKSLKEIAEKVNYILPKLKEKLRAQLKVTGLPDVLENMVFDYCDTRYPEDFQKFFELSDEAIDEMIDIYIQEIENKNPEINNSKVCGKRKLENIES